MIAPFRKLLSGTRCDLRLSVTALSQRRLQDFVAYSGYSDRSSAVALVERDVSEVCRYVRSSADLAPEMLLLE